MGVDMRVPVGVTVMVVGMGHPEMLYYNITGVYRDLKAFRSPWR